MTPLPAALAVAAHTALNAAVVAAAPVPMPARVWLCALASALAPAGTRALFVRKGAAVSLSRRARGDARVELERDAARRRDKSDFACAFSPKWRSAG